jgi:hypothetical protein
MPADSNATRSRVSGKVRWRRFAIVAVPSVAIAGTLVGLTAQGAIASSISVSGQEFLVTANQLVGTNGFEQFGGVVTQTNGTPHPVVISAIGHATLTNLCQSVTVGPVTLRLTAGSAASNPVVADNLIVDAGGQTGSTATFNNITIGQDASTLNEVPAASSLTQGDVGGFGQQADSMSITNLVQNTWLTTAGTFTLPGLSIGFGGSCS